MAIVQNRGVVPINSLGEVVVQAGTGGTVVVGFMDEGLISVDTVTNAVVYAGLSGAQATISGVYKVDEILTATPSAGYAFSAGVWKRDGATISGQTALTYKQVVADIGKLITFTPTNPVYTAVGGVTQIGVVSLPGAPTIGTLTAGNAKATATWTAPTNTGGTVLTGYRITPSVGSPVDVLANVTSADVPGTNGVAFTVTVQALNSEGYGPASAASNSATPVAPAVAPGAPTSPTLTAGDGQVTATWVAPASNGGSAITGYTVTPSVGSAFNVGNVLTTAIPATNGTAITFTVRAINAVGTGSASVVSNSVTPMAVINVSQYTLENQSSNSPVRLAMLDSSRTSMTMQNPSTNTQSIEIASTTNANNSLTAPTTGYVSIAPGEQLVVTGTDATKQYWMRVPVSLRVPITALTSSGLVATATIVGHGLTTGDVRGFEGTTPSGFNILSIPVTVTGPDTITYSLLSTQGAATVLGYMIKSTEILNIKQEVTP
jgi:hypothetical protein